MQIKQNVIFDERVGRKKKILIFFPQKKVLIFHFFVSLIRNFFFFIFTLKIGFGSVLNPTKCFIRRKLVDWTMNKTEQNWLTRRVHLERN